MLNDGDRNEPTIISIKTTKEDHDKIILLCKQQNTTISELIQNFIKSTVKGNIDNRKSIMTEETMVAMIYFEFTVKNQPFNVIVETLSEIHNVSVSFVLHCMGKMLLSGIKLNEIKL